MFRASRATFHATLLGGTKEHFRCKRLGYFAGPGTAPEVATRLREIGLGEDQIVKLLTGHANIICLVCNARLTIGAS